MSASVQRGPSSLVNLLPPSSLEPLSPPIPLRAAPRRRRRRSRIQIYGGAKRAPSLPFPNYSGPAEGRLRGNPGPHHRAGTGRRRRHARGPPPAHLRREEPALALPCPRASCKVRVSHK